MAEDWRQKYLLLLESHQLLEKQLKEKTYELEALKFHFNLAQPPPLDAHMQTALEAAIRSVNEVEQGPHPVVESAVPTPISGDTPQSKTPQSQTPRRSKDDKSRRCGQCTADFTAGNWLRDHENEGGYICQKCYYKRRATRAKTQGNAGKVFQCPSCKKSKLADKFQNGQAICSKCTRNSDALLQPSVLPLAPVRTCGGCETVESRSWYKDQMKEGYICMNCYKRRRYARIKSES